MDATRDVHPRDNCPLCHLPLLDDFELAIIESGQIVPLRKDPNFQRFLPDVDNEDFHVRESSVIGMYHAQCLLMRFDFMRMERVQWKCQCRGCDHSFRRDRYAFRIQVGHVDENRLVFVATEDERNEGLLCSHCTFDGLGEGNLEEGKCLLLVA